MADPKNYVVTVNAGITRLTLPGEGVAFTAGDEVEMTPTQFKQMNVDQLAAVTITQSPSDGGLTQEQLDALATDAEVLAAIGAIPAPPPRVFQSNGTNDAIIPLDNSDSWVVGSDRMDRDVADATKDRRSFFNKVKGAFRAGRATGTHWNDGSVGDYSFACNYNNTASGSSSHAIGQSTVASGMYSHSEGTTTTASGNASHAEGESSTASAPSSHAEGSNSTASGSNSHAQGNYALASRSSQHAHASGRFAVVGDAQLCQMVGRYQTTSATPAVLTGSDLNGAPFFAGSATNVLSITASRAYMLKISAVARRTDVQGEMAGFTWEGLVGRDSTGSARIIGTPIEAAWGDTPATDAWTLAVSIDTTNATNNYVAVTATGEAGKTIRWVAKMEWTEVAG